MTEERKQELRQLLTDAMTSLEIRRSGTESSLIPVDIYRERLRQRWTSRSDDSLILMGKFEPHIVTEAIESKILSFITQEFATFIHEDRILSASCFFSAHPGAGYPITDLLAQLLNIVIVRGTEEAVQAFARCTEKDTHGSVQYIALLEGIRLESEIQVFDDIRLVPLPASTADLPRYLPRLITHTSGLSESFFCSKTLIIIDYSVSPIFHHPLKKATRHEHFNQTNRKIRINVADLSENFCQALSLACNSAVQIILEWRFLSAAELFNLSGLGVGGMSNKYNVDLSESFARSGEPQINDAKHLYHILTNLPSAVGKKLRIPINRWIKSRTNKDFVDKMIDLRIALEALYATNAGGKMQQVYNGAARHLGKGKGKGYKGELRTKFEQIYRCCSDAVHDGEIPQTASLGEKCLPMSEFISKSQNLCRKSIMKVLEGGELPN